MPRQLPWLSKGAGSRTQIKQTPNFGGTTKTRSDVDDDFFDGTVLAVSSKGNARANNDDSDDELPDLPAEPSTTRTKSKIRYTARQSRAASSSPPPIDEFVQPQTEYMRAGVSKFDLRDDEWMMVEDEFLETAKLFTRHLHIAEYKKLKERIESKKAQVGVARPVVASEKMSFEGKMKEKAKAQEIKQKKAIRDVFASQNDEDDDHANSRSFARTLPRQTSSKSATSALLPPHRPALNDSDSDDLDTTSYPTSRPKTSNAGPAPVSASASALSSISTAGPKSALPAAPTPSNPESSFAKPLLPTKQRSTVSRRNRLTPFDMLDGYKPPIRTNPKPHSHSAAHSTSPVKLKPSSTPINTTLERSTDVDVKPGVDVNKDVGKRVEEADDWGTSTALRKATADRLAKRKAEREKERSEKRKTIKLEDIPTFLY
ncbi:hypothetical protein FB567DRAFT_35680 [Paraphoma chrysanthemicola]|uniref:Uncharacterized protein n=1 Tax=Paraphoma chrysanthemicola TaxID=798071 RepID=A0A8K0RIK9_9PLEO|nr:hypothetical protein FB567DRAFT_35680 [Paraphoma chrysanthemicola]